MRELDAAKGGPDAIELGPMRGDDTMRAGDIIDSVCRRATTIYCIFRPSAIFHPPARHLYPIPNATR